ncbi:MAG: carotenoid biosynthesis protein [Chloroflexi bacterium]|nr:carotenoid biosynthesis protein [Chloroflexota bacterium]
MKLAWLLLIGHAVALAFDLAGLMVALPHPELWSTSEAGQQTFRFGMQYAGPLPMVLGAAAMLAYGQATLGWRRTTIFFALACGLSLSAELIGTGTGYPFGNYAYLGGLGYQVLGRVPFSIPLSWFYMGLASFLLGSYLAGGRPVWSVVLGAYFLTVWDLVLDPAMANPGLPRTFWVWHVSGPYFGMPVQNFLGWAATAALFMGCSRWLWGETPANGSAPVFSLTIYGSNLVFAMLLSAAGGEWAPVGLALALGVGGAAVAVRGHSSVLTVGAWGRRQAARLLIARAVDLHVVGAEQVPTRGAVVLVARHYHHLYDAAAILASMPRAVHIVIAVDWLGQGLPLQLMRWLADVARWPVVWRRGVGWRFNRAGYESARRLLREGRVLLIFPEGYPTIDPAGSRKSGDFLPFEPGFLALAERSGVPVTIVPVGIAYASRPDAGRSVWLRYGRPLRVGVGGRGHRQALVASVEAEVRRLSEPERATSRGTASTAAAASGPR